MMEPKFVIVMGRNYTSRLGMIRAAGKAGYKVAVIKTDKNKKTASTPERIDAASKYVEPGMYYYIKEPDDEELINILMKDLAETSYKPILLPTDDYTAAVIDKNLDKLSQYFKMPNCEMKQGMAVYHMDKAHQKELAKAAGLNVAEGYSAEYDAASGKYILPEGVVYPVFIKPEVSFQGSKHMMQRCDNAEQLEKVLGELDGSQNGTVLIEQFIEIEKEYDIPGVSDGCDTYLPGVIEKGLIYLGVTGTGTMYDSSKLQDAIDKLRTMINGIHFTGLVDIELYESKGVVYFNELNMRFGASGFAMTNSGINMPYILMKTLDSEDGRFAPDDIKDHVTEGTFASEKVCFQKYLSGQLSWKEYKKTIDKADFTFVEYDKDPKPGDAFRFYKMGARVKKVIKKIKK